MKKIIMAVGWIGIALTAIAQTDSTKKSTTNFTYSLDAYYRYDFNDAATGTNNLTSFTNSKNSFELGMASIKVDHSIGKVSATADLGLGKRAQEFSYNDVNTLVAVKQLFISYAPSAAIKFSIGKWATHIGYELLDAYLNRNYSMSYAFSYGPFFHTGIKADVSLGGKSAFMIGVANPTDFSSTTSPAKVFIAQFSTGTLNDKIKAFFNFQGSAGFNQVDLVVNGIITNRFAIGYDGTIKTVQTGTVKNSWSSNALYFNYDPSSKFGITLRGEYFADGKNIAGVGASVVQTTLSGNIHNDNLTIIPEIRMDNAGANIFSKNTGTVTKNDASFIIAAVYKF
ncbi:MAG: outer membrane beta-barrel protein [Sediminibacterium sp.]